MQQVGVRELKNQTTEILRNVQEARAEYIVTVRGEPVARLLPIREPVEVVSNNVVSNNMVLNLTERLQQAANIERTLAENSDLRAENRKALEILRDWLLDYQPEDDAIMDEFDQLLATHHFSLSSHEMFEVKD